MSILDMPQLVADHDDPRILHSLWCRSHWNEDPIGSPEYGCCTIPFELAFPPMPNMESVRTAKAMLSFAACDLSTGFEPSFVFLSVNNGGDMQIEAWKCAPIGYVLLAAEAQSRGESEQAQRFLTFARDAVAAHLAEVAA